MRRSTPARPIDWDEIKRRLEVAERALSEAPTLTAAQRRAVMEARARAVAARTPAAPDTVAALDVVEFTLANQRLAIESVHVREVRQLDALTTLPCTPAFVSGIINAHGRILAVIDLKTFLGLAGSGLCDLSKVIILEHGDLFFGVLADRIVGAIRVPLSSLQAVTPAMDAARAQCVRGMTSDGLVVIDALRLAADPALLVRNEGAP